MSKYKSLLNQEQTYEFQGGQSSNSVKVAIWPQGQTGSDDNNNKLYKVAAQAVNAQASKTVRPIYEIGSSNYYLIDGRPIGQGSISHVFGPTRDIAPALAAFSNICTPCVLEFNAKAGCKVNGESDTSGNSIYFEGGVMTSVAYSASTADFMVTGQLSFIFADVGYYG